MLSFNKEYYKDVVGRYGYVLCEDLCVSLPLLTLSEMMNWLCVYNIDTDMIRTIKPKNTLILMGVGVNREPHIGTVSQIQRAIFLQKKGYEVQIVLGDLDSYNSRSSNVSKISENVEKYRNFSLRLGFDGTKGVIRNQFNHEEIMKTAFLIAPNVRDQDFFDVEEDLSSYYKDLGVYNGIEFKVKQAILMMFSDFIHPGFVDGYKHIIVMSGIDEHTYVPKANEIATRLGAHFSISGLFSPIISGFNGQPKMSKSLSNSSIWVTTPHKVIADLIQSVPDCGYYEDSIVYQLMCGTLLYDREYLLETARDFHENKSRWEQKKRIFSSDLSEVCELWGR